MHQQVKNCRNWTAERREANLQSLETIFLLFTSKFRVKLQELLVERPQNDEKQQRMSRLEIYIYYLLISRPAMQGCSGLVFFPSLHTAPAKAPFYSPCVAAD